MQKTNNKINTKISEEKLPQSKVKITVTINTLDALPYLPAAKRKVMSETEIKGFRKGQVPETLFNTQFGIFPIYQELAYVIIDKTYTDVLVDNKIQALGRPEIALVDFGEGKDIVYEMTLDIMPQIELGDYMLLHKDFKEEVISEVTDFDVEEALKDITAWRKNKPNYPVDKPSSPVDKLSNPGDNFDKDASVEEVKSENDMQLTKEDIVAMGIESGDLADLKIKIKNNLKEEKEFKVKDKRRNEILTKLINDTKGDMPNSFIENELLKMKDRIMGDLSNMGVTFADYLKHMKKTEEGWKEAERAQAEKNAKLQIALLEISKKENLAPSKEAIDKEVEHLKLHYKDIDEARLREYSAERMTNTFILEYVMTGKLPNEEELFKVDHSHDDEDSK